MNKPVRIVLASGSPRRKELMSSLKIPFEIITSGVLEDIDYSLGPPEIVKALAKLKADAVAETLQEGLVIGSDTTIAFEGKILGKPKDIDDAKKMLAELRNKYHQVLSGIALIDVSSNRFEVGAVMTHIKMRDYTDAEIDNYVSSGEPLDKAGSYAIQGKGGVLVENINGCFNNVVGFPLCELGSYLRTFDIELKVDGPICKLPSNHPCPRLTL